MTKAEHRAIVVRGIHSGLHTTWTLGKIIFPITFFVVILQHMPAIDWLISALGPVMGILGLSGEAAIPLVLGVTLNLYAAIAAILSLTLTVKEVFILAVLLSFAHNMFIETGVALKVGVRLWVVLLVRFGLGILWALIIRFGWSGGNEIAQYSMAPQVVALAETWPQILLLALTRAISGTVQVAVIVIPLMLLVQLLKEHHLLHKFSAKMSGFTRIIGVRPNASLTLVAGFLSGLVYGAGIMVQAVEEEGVTRKDATLVMIFLMASHAIIEDTLLFVPLGIPVSALLLLRVVTAILVTATASAIWSWWNRRQAALVQPAVAEQLEG